jgi:hypothetical protein
MADWYGSSRSNYFKVKDVDKFKGLCDLWGIESISKDFDILLQNCEACLKKAPDVKCSEYVKRVVDKCEGRKEKQLLHGFLGSSDFGGLPSFREEEDEKTGQTTEYEFDDFLTELATNIEDGWVAIMMECGAEKLRYITGFAMAINSKGEKNSVSLEDIYEKAEKMGTNNTRVEY